MNDGLDVARAMLPGRTLELVDTLRGSDRAQVQRVRVRDSGGAEQTVIVKVFGANEGWARETDGLQVMAGHGPVAELIAESAASSAVVCADVGAGPSVADLLLGDRPIEAAEAVTGWATAVARLHVASLPLRDAFDSALSARAGAEPLAADTTCAEVDEVATRLAEQCAALDVVVPARALDELRGLARRLDAGAHGALSPADTCPDNNVRRDDRFVLIDFEGARWQHIVWDVAYLSVPWPSCWCSWRLPDDVVAAAVARYREVVREALPYVGTPAFDSDLRAATVGWAFISSSWLLPRALGDDPGPGDPRVVTPTRRATILHRLADAAGSEELPALGELAVRLRGALVSRWGETPLDYAPAFRSA